MSYLEHLFAEKTKGTQNRLGLLFDTKKNHYLLDTGTNKVVQIEEPLGYEFLNLFFSTASSFDAFKSFVELHKRNETIALFLQQLESEHLLQAFEVEGLHLFGPGRTYKDQLMNHFQQLTLEVTGKCNFRCKYCIYSEDYEGNRDFNSEDMTWDIAEKAIDFALNHSDKKVSITFYGGEPLINYKLIKESIDYSLSKRGDKEISYSFTSNMSLMTEEMAEYFASIPNLSAIASIDGPESIHNSFRVYTNNNPTFNDSIRGLEYIANAFKKTGNILMINAVYTPPYSYERSKQMSLFYESLPYLDGVQIQVTYPSPGSLHNIEKLYDDGEDKDTSLYDIGNPLSKWAWETFVDGSSSPMAEHYMFEKLKLAHFRLLLNSPKNFYPLNGCCVPGVRRLYVKTNGDFALCERIGNSPVIGNIHSGVDISRVTKFYIDDYEKASLPDCSRCWAINICDLCYAHFYESEGISIDKKREMCHFNRERIFQSLCMYHHLLEDHPEKLEIFKNVELA